MSEGGLGLWVLGMSILFFDKLFVRLFVFVSGRRQGWVESWVDSINGPCVKVPEGFVFTLRVLNRENGRGLEIPYVVLNEATKRVTMEKT